MHKTPNARAQWFFLDIQFVLKKRKNLWVLSGPRWRSADFWRIYDGTIHRSEWNRPSCANVQQLEHKFCHNAQNNSFMSKNVDCSLLNEEPNRVQRLQTCHTCGFVTCRRGGVMMHAGERGVSGVTTTTPSAKLWLNKALSHRGASSWVTVKTAAVQKLSGESNRQPHGHKPTAVTRPGRRRPRWAAATTAGMLLSSGCRWLIACMCYRLTPQHLVSAGDGNSLRTRGNKRSSYIRFT